MKAYEKIKSISEKNDSILCVGLDTDVDKIPYFLGRSARSILEFNRKLIEATSDLVCAYKLNFAFYEVFGSEGFAVLEKTIDAIPDEIAVIADAKRGDIGNTSKAYAKALYERFGADAATVNPYMGIDSVLPFLKYKDKLTFILAMTSNKGSKDFQRLRCEGKTFYKKVIATAKDWGDYSNVGFVTGATHPDVLRKLRQDIRDNFFLIPGIGSQGGDIESVIKANGGCPAIVNVSRSVIFASKAKDYQDAAREQAILFRNAFRKYSK